MAPELNHTGKSAAVRASALAWTWLCGMSLVSVSAVAAEPDGPGRWTLGAGVAATPSPYLDVKSRTRLIPVVSYARGGLRVADGVYFGGQLSPEIKAELGVQVGFSEGYKASDSWALQGMQKRRIGVWLGPQAKWRSGQSEVQASWQADASGRGNGFRMSLGYSHTLPVGGWVLSPSVGASWWSQGVTRYLFGVQESEATALRPEYVPGATTNLNVGLKLIRPITASTSVALSVSGTRYGDEVANSPIVGRRQVNVSALTVVSVF